MIDNNHNLKFIKVKITSLIVDNILIWIKNILILYVNLSEISQKYSDGISLYLLSLPSIQLVMNKSNYSPCGILSTYRQR